MKTLLWAASLVLVALPASASEDLARRNACVACHLPDKKLVGPSYKDIAAKRAGDPLAYQKALDSIKKGSTGTFGKEVMPPNVAVKDADAQQLARWSTAKN